jgi:hypothetical protein
LNRAEQARARPEPARSGMEAHRKELNPEDLKELTDF